MCAPKQTFSFHTPSSSRQFPNFHQLCAIHAHARWHEHAPRQCHAQPKTANQYTPSVCPTGGLSLIEKEEKKKRKRKEKHCSRHVPWRGTWRFLAPTFNKRCYPSGWGEDVFLFVFFCFRLWARRGIWLAVRKK